MTVLLQTKHIDLYKDWSALYPSGIGESSPGMTGSIYQSNEKWLLVLMAPATISLVYWVVKFWSDLSETANIIMIANGKKRSYIGRL